MKFKFKNNKKKYFAHFKKVNRPDWPDYFLGLSFLIAQRSEDVNTHHGCILTDRNNHIIATGYNSLPRGISDGLLPNTRPHKYKSMIHAEENALLNKTLDPWLIPEGGVCYCTGKSCLRCLYRLWNSNIRTLYYYDNNYHFQNCEEEKEDFDAFVKDTGIEVIAFKANLEWLSGF